MSGVVAHIWRHPIKSHGREELKQVALVAGCTMPWDRTWAVAHAEARTDGTDWVPCANFSRVSKAPALQAITATLDEAEELVTLFHPVRPPLRFHPAQDSAAFLSWVAPLMPADRAVSAKIVRVPGRGMTDTDYPSISLNNLASNHAVGQNLGMELSPLRWRGNIWLDGLRPWQEFDWLGKTIRIGSADLVVREPIRRCLATTANPETGRRDADTLQALQSGWGHQEFGVYCEVVRSGEIRIGDTPEILQ